MLIFGMASGSAIFTAQYWGRRDIKNIRAVMGIGLSLTLGLALIFTAVTFLFPHGIIRLFSRDPAVISLGGTYLRIISFTFIITSLTTSFGVVLRSTENVIYPMAASITGIILNTGLNYLLIFGNFGFPRLGVAGAAYATFIARFVEMGIIVSITYIKKLPAAAGISDLIRFTKQQVSVYLQKAVPVVLQSVGWAAGFSMYTMIYGHINTESLASYNVAGSIERICLIFFTGLGSACSIMVGNRIGAGEDDKARGFARNFSPARSTCRARNFVGTVHAPRSHYFLYAINETSRTYMMGILLVMSVIMWARACNIIFHMGVFKAGGDTLFSMIVDVGGVWLIGVPIALVTAFYFHLPIHYIVAWLMIEELLKMIVGFWRYRSGKWLNNLVVAVEKKETVNEA